MDWDTGIWDSEGDQMRKRASTGAQRRQRLHREHGHLTSPTLKQITQTARGANRDVRAHLFPCLRCYTSCLSQSGHVDPRKHTVKGKKQILRLRRLYVVQDPPRPRP